MEYKMSIGLEVHAELLTKTKIFCSCENKFGGEENTRCCPVCTGFPGTLPTLNKKAVELCIRAGLALNCEIAKSFCFARKNYFYPDLPKAYQISQSERPVCKNGYLETKYGKVGILNIHLEEDAGKLIHKDDKTYIDYNRCGVPLIEIVSEPDMHSAEEAGEFLQKLKKLLKSLYISDCNMQEGSLRCDVNISLSKEGEPLGERCEYKNINTFKGVIRAIMYEEKRQLALLGNGKTLQRETRRWDDEKGEGTSLRTKENIADYRYFDEPDIPPVTITEDKIYKIKQNMPESGEEKKQRYIREHFLSSYDAELLSENFAALFEEAIFYGASAKEAANLILGDISKHLNEGISLTFGGKEIAEIVALLNQNIINNTTAKKVLEIMFLQKKAPKQIVAEQNLAQITDEKQIQNLVNSALDKNKKAVEDYKKGKTKVFGFLLGQVMAESKNKANVESAKRLLTECLKEK